METVVLAVVFLLAAILGFFFMKTAGEFLEESKRNRRKNKRRIQEFTGWKRIVRIPNNCWRR